MGSLLPHGNGYRLPSYSVKDISYRKVDIKCVRRWMGHRGQFPFHCWSLTKKEWRIEGLQEKGGLVGRGLWGSLLLIRIQIQHFKWIRIRIRNRFRIRIQGFDDQKLEKYSLKFFVFVLSKISIYLTLWTSKLQEKPSALKREHPAFQKMKFNNCFLFFWVISALMDPDPEPQHWRG